MPPPPPPAVRSPPAPPARFASCSRVLHAPFERAPGEAAREEDVEPIPYRRCPVGLIASLDCPELVGIPCLHHDPRGDRPKAVVPRAEVALLGRELAAAGYLTTAYRRRLVGLRIAVPPPRPLAPIVAAIDGADGERRTGVPPARRSVARGDDEGDRTGALVNLPSDEARRVRAAKRASGASPRPMAGPSAP